MKAIVTVIGKDKVGIIARVSAKLFEMKANIEDISQTLMQDYFVMMMMVDITGSLPIMDMGKKLEELGKDIGVQIRIQNDEIFNCMHRI